MSTAIPPLKRLAILGLCCFLVWGHLSDVVTGKEHWPFSNYPMYSGVYRSRTLKTVRLAWITDDVRPREMGVGGIYARTKYEGALKRLKTPRDRRHLIEMMRSAVQSERQRRQDYGIQPQVKGLRVYQLTYHMTPRLQGRAVPDETVLVAQVGLPSLAGASPTTMPSTTTTTTSPSSLPRDFVREPSTRRSASTRPAARPNGQANGPAPAEVPTAPGANPDQD